MHLCDAKDPRAPGQHERLRVVGVDTTACTFVVARGELTTTSASTASQGARQTVHVMSAMATDIVGDTVLPLAPIQHQATESLYVTDPVGIRVTNLNQTMQWRATVLGCANAVRSVFTYNWTTASGWSMVGRIPSAQIVPVAICTEAKGVSQATYTNIPFCKLFTGNPYEPDTWITLTNQIVGTTHATFTYSTPITGGCSWLLTPNIYEKFDF